MNISNLEGNYILQGTNQDAEGSTYQGSLSLSMDKDGRFNAIWLIDNNQIQHGLGTLKNEKLVIDFEYIGEDEEFYQGVVAYDLATENTLDGVWTEKAGDSNYVGIEKAFKVKNEFID